MTRPAFVKPGDILVHHVDQKSWVNHLIGDIEGWGEYAGRPGEDDEACHVEAMYDLNTIAKMNPPESSKYSADDAPWDRIQVLRLDLKLLSQPGVPRFPCDDPAWVKAFQEECDAHMGEKYSWGSIFGFGLVGLVSHLNPAWGQWLLRKQNPVTTGENHNRVCSQWLTDRIENTTRSVYPAIKTFDLFAGMGLGEDQERPADFSCSAFVTVLKG